MNVPPDLLYTKEHEWVLVENDTATVGITDYAQQELGDVVYIELPDEGATFEAEESFGSVESVKAVSEIYMPLAGKVLEVNADLVEAPEVINEDPYGEGWMIRIAVDDVAQIDQLMSTEEYQSYLEEESD
ncbi:MAG: glycine cleavage system protein GcvH [Acidobacteriota bacterium]|jgi:glycine cleavage system H protein